MRDVWSATDARANFATLLDAAQSGVQRIERRDGSEFVLVSKEIFAASRASLAEHLINSDLNLDEQQSNEWMEVMAEVQGKDPPSP